MAKRIAVLTLPGKTVEALPQGNSYPTGAITIPQVGTAGNYAVYEKTDVADNFHAYGQADIYVDGVYSKTIIYDPDLAAIGKERIGMETLKEESVNKRKTDFLVPGDNLFDPYDAVEGEYFNDSNGQLISNPAFLRTGYIPIKASTQYAEIQPSPAYGNYYHFFDADYNWISRTAVGSGFTTPANAAYFGRNLASNSANFTSAKGSYMVAEGTNIAKYKSFNLYLGDKGDKKYLAYIPFKNVGSVTDTPDYDGQIGKDTNNNVYTGVEIGSAKQYPIASIHESNSAIVHYDSMLEKVNSLFSVLKKTANGGTNLADQWIDTANNISWVNKANNSEIIDSSLIPYMMEFTPTSSSSPYIRSRTMVNKSTSVNSFVFGFWLKVSQLKAWIDAQSDKDKVCLYFSIYDGVTFPVFNMTANILYAMLGKTGYNYTSTISGAGLNCNISIRISAVTGDFAYFEIIGDSASGNFSALYFYFQVAGGYADAGSLPFTILAPRMIFDVKETHPFAVYRDNDSIARSNVLDRAYFEQNYAGSPIRDKIRVLRSGNDYYIRSYFDLTRDVVLHMQKLSDRNTLFSFQAAYLIANTDIDSADVYTSGTLIKSSSDDIAPWYTDNVRYIGANHGINCMNVDATGHNKTTSDIGSTWSDGTRQWKLTEVNGDFLVFLGVEYSASGSWRIDYSTAATTLTHVSGAVNTSDITIVSQSLVQKYPIAKNISYEVLANGKKTISDGKTEYCDFVDFKETYDIIDPATINVSYPVDYSNASNMWIRNSLIYRFGQNGSCVLYYTAELNKELDFGYTGFLQASKMNQGTYGKIWGYIPGVTTISDGSKTWDFKAVDDFTTNPAANLVFDSSKLTDATKPVNRMIQFLGDASKNYDVAFAHGYNPVYSQAKDSDRLNNNTNFWEINSTGKSYPRCFDSKKGILPAGTIFNAVIYRQIYNPKRTGSGTSVHWIAIADFYLVFLDYHIDVTRDKVILPSHLTGKAITIIDKSASLTIEIADYVPSDGLIVSVTGGYGYGIIKLE